MKSILLILLCIFSLNLFGQTEYGSHTLFDAKKENLVNGYISFDGSLTNVNTYAVGTIGSLANVDSYIVGSAGVTLGATINHSLTFGVVGMWVFDSPDNKNYIIPPSIPSNYKNSEVKKYCGYGGFLIEPTIFPKFPFHLTLPCVVGIGAVTYALQDDNYWTSYDYVLDRSTFYIFTAGARIEFNISDGLRLSCGPTYKYIPNLNKIDSTPTLMNGFCLDFSIKIGKY